MKTDEKVAAHQPLSRTAPLTPQTSLDNSLLRTKATANKHDCAIVVMSLVLVDCTA